MTDWSAFDLKTGGPERIYYIAVREFVKVGFSTNVKMRLIQFETMNPYGAELLYVERGDLWLEGYRHFLLSKYKHRGEWFHRPPVEEFIDVLKNKPETIEGNIVPFQGSQPIEIARRDVLP